MIRKITLLIFLFILNVTDSLPVNGLSIFQAHVISESSAQNAFDPTKRIDSLIEAFVHEANLNNHEQDFDSLAAIAFSLAESIFDNQKMLEIGRNYFKHVSLRGKYVDFAILAERTEQLLLENDQYKEKFEYWLIISNAAAKLYYAEIAHKFALKAISESGYDKKPAQQIKAVLALGKSLEIQQFYIEAYQNFLEALFMLEKINNSQQKKELKMLTYDHLFDFHSVVMDFEHAAQYKKLEIKLIESESTVDSVRLMWAKYDLCGLLVLAEKYQNLKAFLEELIEFSNRKKDLRLKDFTFSLYRTYLNKVNDINGLYELYLFKYPDELTRLEIIEPIVYFQTMAKIAEFQNNLPDAFYNYDQAINQINESLNPVLISNFYKRYGQFLLRNGRVRDAKAAFAESFQQAKRIQYLDFMKETSKYLDSVSVMLGDYKGAHTYSAIHKAVLIKQHELNQQTEFLKMELANESRRIEWLKQQRDEQIKRKYNLQYLLITVLITLIFLLFILLNRFRVPEWAVKGLAFLNILMLFELIILFLDQRIHQLAHGEPIKIFIVKVLILIILFPLHHVTEEAFIKSLTRKKLILKPSYTQFKHFIHKLWPWLENSKRDE